LYESHGLPICHFGKKYLTFLGLGLISPALSALSQWILLSLHVL